MKKNIFNIMVNPRGFIKSLPKEKIGSMPLFLAWVIGMVYLMRQATGFQLSFYFSYGWIVLASIVLAIPVGYIIMYIFAFFMYWAGKLFKGKASYKDLFSATAYARVPEVFVLISWILLIALLGQVTFTQVYVLVGLPPLISMLMFAQIVFYLWELIISLHTIGEVQGFSAWMSLWNYIIAGVIVLLIAFFIEFMVAIAFSLDVRDGNTLGSILGLIQ